MSDPISDDDLILLTMIMDRASPEPWKAEGTIYEHMAAEIRCAMPGAERGIAQIWVGDRAFDDARFIALARTLVPAIVSRLQGAEACATKAEAERDEAIKDRDAHAAHVLRLAAEAKAGFAALEEIDACWEAYGTASNRKHLTLSEQIASTLRELEDMSENYGNAEGELKMAEAERDSLTQLLADSDEARNILTQAVLERCKERDEANKYAPIVRELQFIRVGMLDQYQAATILERMVGKAQALPIAPPSARSAQGAEHG